MKVEQEKEQVLKENCDERPYKLIVREETIINVYREVFGRESLPKDKQYWTTCGRYVDRKGNPVAGSEIDQLITEGLLIEEQILGVNYNKDTIEQNKKAYPNACWHIGDLFCVLSQMDGNAFRPGIIYIDSFKNMQSVCSLLGDVMSLLGQPIYDGEVMIVANMPVGKGLEEFENGCANKILESLSKDDMFISEMEGGKWELYPNSYNYMIPKGSTVMATVILTIKP